MSHRTPITLDDAQYELLVRLSREKGRSIAELVRRAVDLVYGGRADPDEQTQALKATFGAWSPSATTGEACVEQLRSGGRLAEPGRVDA